jgi:hypothetical protein
MKVNGLLVIEDSDASRRAKPARAAVNKRLARQYVDTAVIEPQLVWADRPHAAKTQQVLDAAQLYQLLPGNGCAA